MAGGIKVIAHCPWSFCMCWCTFVFLSLCWRQYETSSAARVQTEGEAEEDGRITSTVALCSPGTLNKTNTKNLKLKIKFLSSPQHLWHWRGLFISSSIFHGLFLKCLISRQRFVKAAAHVLSSELFFCSKVLGPSDYCKYSLMPVSMSLWCFPQNYNLFVMGGAEMQLWCSAAGPSPWITVLLLSLPG